MLVSGALLWHKVLTGDVCIRAVRENYLCGNTGEQLSGGKEKGKEALESFSFALLLYVFFFFLDRSTHCHLKDLHKHTVPSSGWQTL